MKKLNDKGFTLVELITTMMITMIIGAAIISILIMTLSLYTQQQKLNQQYIIIDHVESVLSQELRYADPLYILDASDSPTSQGCDYYIMMYNGGLYKCYSDGSDPVAFCSSDILEGYALTVYFANNANESILEVTVCIDEGTDGEVIETFYIESLNLELNNNAVQGDSGTIICYDLP